MPPCFERAAPAVHYGTVPCFFLKRKSARACLEQKFRCQRLETDNSKTIGGDPKCAHSYSAACSLRRCLFPHSHKPILRLLRRRRLPSLRLREPLVRPGDASKLIGLNVYNDQDEKLGDISEILVDKSGKVDGVVIGVGGFLGMGRHDIMVEMSKLKFVDEPVRTSSTTTSTTGSATPATANRPAPTNEPSCADLNDVHHEKQVVS